MTSMIPFDFNGQDVRTFTKDGESWFVARDVAQALGYTNPSEAVRDHCKKVRRVAGSDLLVASNGGASSPAMSHNDRIRRHQIINEADLYRLVLRSNLPAAEQFADWVCEEVLPALRHTGHYAVKDSHLDRELQTCSVDYAHLREPLMGRRGISREEDKLLQGFDQAMQAAGLPAQFQGVAPDPAIYRVTPALARVAIEFLAVGKEVGRVEVARERLVHLCTG